MRTATKSTAKTQEPTVSFVYGGNNQHKQSPDTQRIMNDTFVKNASDMGGIKCSYLPLSEMVVCDLYQRAPQNKINKIAREWDIQQCGMIIVSYRNGKFYIVDGQNRYLAAGMVGLDALPCQIFENLDIKGEARVFANQNINKSNLSSFDLFKAELVAEDETALAVKAICDRYSISTKKSAASTTGTLKGLDITKRIYNNCGEEALEWIFNIIQDCGWHDVKGGYGSVIMAAIYNIFTNHNNELNSINQRLIDILENTTPERIMAKASSIYVSRGQTSALTTFLEKYIMELAKKTVFIS